MLGLADGEYPHFMRSTNHESNKPVNMNFINIFESGENK